MAFEFLSLLSEIGGFLGLLFGASVLTVCELIDFVTLATINKFKKNQNMVRPVLIKSGLARVNSIDGKVPAEDDFNLVSLSVLLISHNHIVFQIEIRRIG